MHDVATMKTRNRVLWVILTALIAVTCGAASIARLYYKQQEQMAAKAELAQAEAALARSERQLFQAQLHARTVEDEALAAMRESADHGFMALDAAGRVVRWNPALEKWTGYTQAEMLGHTLEKVMPPDEYAAHSKNYGPWITADSSNKKTLKLECTLISKTGGLVRVQVTARKVPLVGEGHASYAIGLVDRPRNVVDLTKPHGHQ